MARFRIETVVDAASGLIAAELYYPDTTTTPFSTTEPIYPSHEVAAQAVIEVFKKGFPDKPITVEK